VFGYQTMSPLLSVIGVHADFCWMKLVCQEYLCYRLERPVVRYSSKVANCED
jgi:hypothetical protein